MKCKILSYFIHVEYPERRIEVILGKQMARDYVDRFCGERSDFRKGFILGGEECGVFITDNHDQVYLICLPDEYNATTVFHECFHACMRVWYDAGADLQFPQNDEVITYMQGVMAKKIEELYNAYKE